MQQNDKKDIHWYNILSKKYGSYVNNETIKYQKIYGFEIGTGEHATWKNESDAFKHAYMQAQLALWCGKHLSKFSGDFHEWQGNHLQGQTKVEEDMDNWNNLQGREIAKEMIWEYGTWITTPFIPFVNDIIARKVAERMQSGKLILDPSGRRIPKKKLNISNSSNQKTSYNHQDISQCSGSYSVSGYTRSDGTKVEGYERACFKHSWMRAIRELPEKFKGKKFQDLSPDELQEAISFFI